jgi:hypothetical protein
MNWGKAKEQPKLAEEKKMYGSTSYRTIKRCVMKKEAGIDDDKCERIWSDLGVSEVE